MKRMKSFEKMRGPIEKEEKIMRREIVDGVLPMEFPDEHEILLRSICIRKIEEGIVYIKTFQPKQRLCENCFIASGRRNYTQHEQWHSISSPLHGTDIQIKGNCNRCKKELFWLRPANQCVECIGEYIVLDRVFKNKYCVRENYETEIYFD